MDRPFLPKKIRLFTQILLLCCSLLQTAQAEENNNKIKKPSSKKIVTSPPSVITGTFPGIINFIDEKQRYFRATPTIAGMEKIFYVDEKTIFKIKWKKISIKELAVDDPIKVIYFRQGQTLLANIVSLEKDLVLKPRTKDHFPENKNKKL